MNYENLDKLMFVEPPTNGVYSMDDQNLYGILQSNHPYSELVERKFVTPTSIHLLQTSDAIWDKLENDNDIRLKDETINEEVILDSEGKKALGAAMIATRVWINEKVADGVANKILVFMGRIADCVRAVDPTHILSLVPSNKYNIHCEVFHSGMSPNKRKQAKSKFTKHTGPALMASVRAIREGVSINDADTIVLLRGYGTNNEGDISIELQQHHGRGIRKAPGKEICNVVLPIPPIGRAENIRKRTLRMLRDLMEETGVLKNVIEIIERGDRITAGTLTDNNVHIHPSTSVAVGEIEEAVTFTVLEYIKEYDSPLAEKLAERDIEEYIDEFNF